MIGQVPVGGGAPVSVQSMTCTDTRDPGSTLEQIRALEKAGCEIVRCAVPDETAASALREICRASPLPVVADVHFDHRLALLALSAGAAGLRINPGNIGADWKVREVVAACRERETPIRIGVNAGSLRREDAAAHGGVNSRSLAESALREADLIEKSGYGKIKISAKAFDLETAIGAYRLLAEKTDYPLHLGITEAGPLGAGLIRSAAGIGALLLEGIGDTIRFSLTADPVEEARAARELLQAVGARSFGPVIVSCPTCGRTRIDLIGLVGEVERALASLPDPARYAGVKIAVMGCAVNGPGEARQARIGVAGGDGEGVIFREGEVIRKVPFARIVPALLEELGKLGD